MKKHLLRILSFLLIFATLMPLMAACNDEPPANEGGGGEGGGGSGSGEGEGGGSGTGEGGAEQQYYIQTVAKEYEKTVLVDFDDAAYLDANPVLIPKLTGKGAHTVYALNTAEKTNVAFPVPEAKKNIRDRYYVEVTVYVDTPSSEFLSVNLNNLTAQRIPLNFTGNRTFRLIIDDFTQITPFPFVNDVTVAVSGECGTVYFSSIAATEPTYELSVPDGVNSDDPALYEGIIETYRQMLVGTPSDSIAPSYAAQLDSISEECIRVWKNNANSFSKTYKSDEPNKLFDCISTTFDKDTGEITNLNGSSIWTMYENILIMAKGWGAYGSDYYHSEELLADVKAALEYGYNYCYGKHIAETGKTYGNWWEWDIGIAKALIGSIIIVREHLTQAEIEKYLSPLDTILRYPTGTACNLIDMSMSVLLSAALQRDAYRICVTKEIMNSLFLYIDEHNDPATLGDGGFMTDGSYIQHGSIAYTGSYGHDFIIALGNVMLFMNGSRFAFVGDKYEVMYTWIFENYRPFIFGDCFTASLFGRAVNRLSSEEEKLRGIVSGIIMLSINAPEKYKSELDSLIRYVMAETDYNFSADVPLSLIDYCIALKDDTSIPLPDTYEMAKIYGGMSRAVQHTPKYGVCISMSSTKISKYEAINGENAAGWYHGDGMIYIYTEGYDHDYNFFYFANPYLMPGITVNNAQRNKTYQTPVFNGSDYAGGASQGKYAAVGFILCYDESSIRSTFANTKDSKIQAKKSYFMFDNEIICVGSDIYDISGTGVRTVVDNRLWGENDVFSVNGAPMNAPASAETEISARTMHFTNMGGYVFLGNDVTNGTNKILYKKATSYPINAPSWGGADGTRDFLELSLSHGTGNVSDGKYYYAYLPEATASETESYYTTPDVELIARSGDVHAVLEKTLGILAINYFVDSSSKKVEIKGNNQSFTNVREVESETPCSIILTKNSDGSTTISLSDPTSSYSTVKFYVTMDSVSSVVSADSNVNAKIDGDCVVVTASVNGTMGRSFNVTVK